MSQFVSKEQEQQILEVVNKKLEINETSLIYTPSNFFESVNSMETDDEKFERLSLSSNLKQFEMEVKYKNGTMWVALFYLGQVFGCCGSALLSGVNVFPGCRGNKLGSLIFSIATNIAYQYGYSSIVATDIDDNEVTKHIFEKQGWKIVNQFTNKRTDNLVNTYIKNFYED